MKTQGRVLSELLALKEAVVGLQKQIAELKVDRLAFTFSEAARRLGRSPRTISRMVTRNEIGTVTISGKQMIPARELERITTPKAEPRRGRPSRKTAGTSATRASVEALLKRRR